MPGGEKLSAVQLRYLLLIRQLEQEGPVRSVRIAQSLGVAKSTVHAVLARLVEAGMIDKAHYGRVALTEKGLAHAALMGEGFEELFDFLHGFLQLEEDLSRRVAASLLRDLEIEDRRQLCRATALVIR